MQMKPWNIAAMLCFLYTATDSCIVNEKHALVSTCSTAFLEFCTLTTKKKQLLQRKTPFLTFASTGMYLDSLDAYHMYNQVYMDILTSAMLHI